jgi:cysteine desulfurase
MEAYLDNSATTSCSPAATDKMVELLTQDYGNPSSMHMKGVIAEKYITEAKKKIAKTLKVEEKELFFTSGGTESNNLAIIGSALANKRAGMHVITTKIEHPSVTNPFIWLSENGFEVTYLGVDQYGQIQLDELKNAIRPDTILVSIMHVNNEIGALQPIEAAGKVIKDINPKCLFHVDAIQSYGKMQIFPKKWNVDMLSVSGHKIHGPKGSGFLFIKDKTKVKPMIHGGGQQKGMRSGTENVPAIAGLAVAAEEMYQNLDENRNHLFALRDYFIKEVEKLDGVSVNGKKDHDSAPHIVSVSIEGVRAEVILHTLEDRNIYVSAGSACSSNKPAISSTLQSIGLKKELLDSTVRFSFSIHTTKEELDYALEVMRQTIPMLQRYTRH